MANIAGYINQNELDKAAKVIRALNHDLRMKIIQFIDENPKVHVTKIYKSLGIEQTVASLHLAILREADIVYSERDGRKMLYSVNYDKLEELDELLKKF